LIAKTLDGKETMTRGKLTKTATARWVGGQAFEAGAGSGFTLRMDSGEDTTGFSPMELVLVGLAGCTGMDVVSILEKKRQNLTGLEVRVTGRRAEEHPKVYTEIDVEYIVRGRNVETKAIARAIELSQGKYCSVSNMLKRVAILRTSFQVLADEN